MIIPRSIRPFPFFLLLLACTGCHWLNGQNDPPLFEQLPAEKTAINFSNDVIYDRNYNVLNYSYIYNGGGVAAGDINNDGLPDLYFTGNMVSSRLYLNKGNFTFEDITQSSGTSTTHWAGGASMVDINQDGYLDMYVSVSGPEHTTGKERANRLFINDGDNTFTESAAEYGLADTSYTTHTAFFDYDRDGDLDAYLMNNFAGSFSRDSKIGVRSEVNDGSSPSADALYRNNGDGTFTDVSQEAGILKEGYSLGIAVSDVNRDGWPDVYISNDIQTDDLLYINNQDGTFTDKAAEYLKHTSYAGMGMDIADFNNDGWPDIVQVDMMPPQLQEQQLVSGATSYEHLQELKQQGYQPQHTLNTLQLNNGTNGRGDLKFSEIGQLAGIAHTGWSWTGLFGDYDNDGQKDIFITNGYPKAVNSYDYLMKLNRSTMFGTDSSRAERRYKTMDNLPALKLRNYMFRNNGDLIFEDVTKKWEISKKSFAYGAAHVDLDNDGDLDLAINNINDKPTILNNRAGTLRSNHHLKVLFEGDSLNIDGIGTKLIVTADGQKQYKYFSPYRGYQSTMDHSLSLGMGDAPVADSLEIIWPDGRYQLLTNVGTNQTVTVNYSDADFSKDSGITPSKKLLVSESDSLKIDYRHKENNYIDFVKEPILPRMFSRLGPAAAVADVNNDGREDLFLGAASGSTAKLYLQQQDGTFRESTGQPWEQDAPFEDTGAAFFDANGDGLKDLYVVSGGNSFSPASAQLQDRLYLNTGSTSFIKAEGMLPRMYTSGSTVKTGDYDGDGDPDLFVAGRHVPGQYAAAAKSYILRNDGDRFTDVTPDIAPDLVEPGLITDATWVDFNEDSALDLVVAGEWMPVSFFQNKDGLFQNVTASLGLDRHAGWWQSIEKADLDADGDMDFVAGNFGLNHQYSITGNPAIHMVAGDLDRNPRHDAVISIKKREEYYPLHGMRNMAKQFPRITRSIHSFEAFAASSLSDMFGKKSVADARKSEVNYFASAILINENGDGFTMKPLPSLAQISSINDILITDINKDGHPDLVTAGNIYDVNPEIIQNDAGNGLVLLGDGKGKFRALAPYDSGFWATSNVRELALLNTSDNKIIVVVNNNEELQLMKIRH